MPPPKPPGKPPRQDWASMRARAAGQRAGVRPAEEGLAYDPKFLTPAERAAVVAWIEGLVPIWEQRFSAHHPPPPGTAQRQLLRPVYWLGNWQFACLGYYHPPKGLLNRAVKAEPFPPVLAKLVTEIERRTKSMFPARDVPPGWHLNTCLVNFYGDRIEDGKRTDAARVGEHKDFEPGPVASLSFGERAFFQFVSSRAPGERDGVAWQGWLDDGALQLFGGRKWKDQLFHRVQRVDRKGGHRFAKHVEGFETRRVNLTFRYVPDQHVIPFAQLPEGDAQDVRGYVETLARNSPFFSAELARRS